MRVFGILVIFVLTILVSYFEDIVILIVNLDIMGISNIFIAHLGKHFGNNSFRIS